MRDLSPPVALLLAGLSWPAAANAAEYFVSTQSGYDALNQTTFSPGDGIFLQGGTTFRGGLYFDPLDGGTNAAGALVEPIRLSSFGSGRATIDAGDSFGLFGFNNGGFEVSDLIFRGSGVSDDGATSNTADGIGFFNDLGGGVKQSRVHVDRVDVSGFGGYGFSLGGFNGNAGYDDVRVADSRLHANRRSGLLTYAQNRAANTNVLVDGVRAYGNVGDPGSTGNTGSGIVLGNVDGGVIQRSIAHDNGRNNRPSEGPVGIWTYDSNDVTIQFNESYGNRTSNGDGGGFDLDQNVTNSVLQYNYSHDNDGAGYLIFDGDGTGVTNAGNVVRYNVSENDGRSGNGPAAGITIGGNVRDLEVYGNTVYVTNNTAGTPAEPALKIDRFGATSPEGVLIANNVFSSDGGGSLIFKGAGVTDDASAATGLRLLNNAYFAADGAFQVRWNGVTYTSLDDWLGAITNQERLDRDGDGSAEIVAINADPRLNDPGNGGTVGDPDTLAELAAYLLGDGSPLIDAGADLSVLGIDPGSRDFNGNAIPRNGRLDVGSSQFVPEPGVAAAVLLVAPGLLRRRRPR